MNILSIQSHVVYGHVGNAAAVFTLQRLGFEVWDLHTVQFSRHKGYPDWTGRAFEANHIAELVEGLAHAGFLDDCDAVLSGYLGDTQLAEVVLSAISQVRSVNTNVIYACDPVMGDVDTGLYVDQDLPGFLRRHLCPAADILTPNQFELQCLSDQRIETLDAAISAARDLIRKGPKIVLVTSLLLPDSDPEKIEMLAVTAERAWRVATPFFPFEPMPNGSGDTVSAMFLAHYLKSGDIAYALARTASSIFGIMKATHDAGTRELRLIAAQDQLVSPSQEFEPTEV